MSAQVIPTKFRVLHEDEAHARPAAPEARGQDTQDTVVCKFKARSIKDNFIFERSYPAVVFDKVCFSVSRAEQTSNFLEEVLCRLKDCFSFGPSSRARQTRVDILKSVNLSVPSGSIFGLLGPSSCGKTTLLRCLLDVLKPDSGDIRLFCKSLAPAQGDPSHFCCGGNRSKSRRSIGCQVPGPNVGYMPQDLGLYDDYSIKDILKLFGKYVNLDEELTESRVKFMAEFLDLPDVNRKIHSLSGGQKRRVSFAVACIHMPPLIILDEPTVGVDPLLRQSIWRYLKRLASQENRTIIITTHYIEEAAQADQVALMRAGEVLVQDTPRRIMEMNDCQTLEEAFLKICNNIQQESSPDQPHRYKLFPQPKFNWHDQLDAEPIQTESLASTITGSEVSLTDEPELRHRLKTQAPEGVLETGSQDPIRSRGLHNLKMEDTTKTHTKTDGLSLVPGIIYKQTKNPLTLVDSPSLPDPPRPQKGLADRLKLAKTSLMNERKSSFNTAGDLYDPDETSMTPKGILKHISKNVSIFFALLHKNHKRNLNSLPLIAFQFLLPIVQMISFSLCVGGKPTNIGLGLVNNDRVLIQPNSTSNLLALNATGNATNQALVSDDDLLSNRFISYIDSSMIKVIPYKDLEKAKLDVAKLTLWAAMEIGENFTNTLQERLDIDNLSQLDSEIIRQSVIKLYPDKSNKILDMVCTRSLVDSYRQFLTETFDQFKKIPIEVKEPIYSIKPNLISNSIDGYTESIAAGLVASLTYIMAAGLTTFIMVLERSDGILERTFTSGVNPVVYLLAHATYRSMVMMMQIAVVMFLTFYLLRQPLLGSVWLAYIILITLNLTGISYGLLVSSLVNDQNGAALTVVSSLVVKITLSGILWPFEAIPYWLRAISYIQPLALPIHALKAITLKGRDLTDRNVQLGFLVSTTWMLIFLIIASKRFKFYQH